MADTSSSDAESAASGLAEATRESLDAVLARVWLDGPGDLCPTCAMKAECPDQSRCLHLVASAGSTNRTDGPYRRVPIGVGQVGAVARDLEPFIADAGLDSLGLADPTWLAAHRVASFAALPLESGGRCAGVLALFSRRPLGNGDLELLRLAAAHTAALLAPSNRAVTRAVPGEDPLAGVLRPLADIERDVIERVLAHTGGRVSGPRGAAAILRMKPTTLDSRIKKLGVRKPKRLRSS